MKYFKRILAVVMAVSLLPCWSAPCRAAENAVTEVLETTLYGGLFGTVVGAVALAFTHKPGDHLDYLGYGAAIGALTGVTAGVVKVAMAEVENGKVKFALPTIMPDFPDDSAKGRNPIVITAELIRGKF